MNKKTQKVASISNHGKIRVEERINELLLYGKTNKTQLCNLCLKNGMTLGKYKNKDKESDFYKFLVNKSKPGYLIYLYQKNIFIFSENKVLITIYPVPKKYITTYDRFIREGNNTSYQVYLKDRNTKNLKPFLCFKSKRIARKCVYNLLGKKYQDILKYQKTETAMLDFLEKKGFFKITINQTSNEILERDKIIYQKILKQ